MIYVAYFAMGFLLPSLNLIAALVVAKYIMGEYKCD